VSNESWDANNNRTALVDPRGFETDMAYDASGNLVAVGESAQYSGYGRPTTLIDYDQYGNVTAVCDPALVHTISGNDWSGQYTAGGDTYCSSHYASGHMSAQYDYSHSYEPNGELVSVTSAGGYVRQIGYAAASQAGADYGLATSVSGASITQFDGTTRAVSTSTTYDAHGNVICSQTDAGTNGVSTPAITVNTYDSMNRLTATADADDASLGGCTKSAGIAGSAIVNRRTYYADGTLATTQAPSEAALNAGTVFSYDLDGDQISEAPYSGSPQSPQTARNRSWYDGGDRLIEMQQPADPAISGDIPVSLRYFYDLSQGANATTLNGSSVVAHGNLFDTVKNTPTGWTDFAYSAFDAADRMTTAYAFAPCPAVQGASGPIYCAQPAYATRYDWDSSPLNPHFSGNGLLVATLDGMNVTRMFGYDALGGMDTVQYSGDGGVTPMVSYAHDFDGRLSDFWNSFNIASLPAVNHVAYTYTADGNLLANTNTSLNVTTGYSYYPDATLAGVSASVPTFVNQPNLYQYAYRNDGLVSQQRFGAVANQSVSWSYTRGGRMTGQSDFGSAPSIAAQYADGYGRLSSYATPSGTYGSFQYDAQGRLTHYTDPYTTVDGEAVSSTYNIRGDLVARDYTGGTPASKPGFHYRNIQGTLVQNQQDEFDGRTGATLIANGSQPWVFQYDAIGRLVSGGGDTLTYDGENRVVTGDTFGAGAAADDDCHSGGALASWAPPVRETGYFYDGVGQVLQDYTPVVFRQPPPIRNWFWDGDKPLYTIGMNWNGSFRGPVSYSADGLGTIDSSGMTLADRDLDGSVSQYHNSSGHSAWAATNPYNQFCQHASPLPPGPLYTGPSGPMITDQSSDSSVEVDSYGRAYLSRAMGFTTPDYSSATPYASGTRRPRALVPISNSICASGWWDTDLNDGYGGCSAGPPIGHSSSRPYTSPFYFPGFYQETGYLPGPQLGRPKVGPPPAPTPPPLCMLPNGNVTREAGYTNPPNCGHAPARGNKELECVLLGVAVDVGMTLVAKEPRSPALSKMMGAGAAMSGAGVAYLCANGGQAPPPVTDG
jgi:YD repeat-containing protein